LCRSTYFRGRFEKIDLHAQAEMASSPPDDIVLVARSNEKCVQLAVDLCAYIEGLALEGDGRLSTNCVEVKSGVTTRYKWFM
jgi:hypothetical protein